MSESLSELKKRLGPAEKAFKNIFHSSLKDEIHRREGVVLFLDDRQEQASVLEGLLNSAELKIPLFYVKTIEEAQTAIKKYGPANIKVAIIDIELAGADGRDLLEWIHENHYEIPTIISTGHAELKQDIEKEFPEADIFIKGHTKIEEIAQALALRNVKNTHIVIPQDLNRLEMEKTGNGSLSGFFKRIFAS